MGAADGTGLVTEEAEGLDFESFFEAEYPRLVRMMYLLTSNPDEAKDVAEEAMVRVFERWGRVGSMASPGGYVYQVALNLNRKRAKRRRPALQSHQPSELEAVEARSLIRAALADLPLGQREALVMVEWLGLTPEEAGRVLGIEPPSVRSRIHRAKLALRELLEFEDG